MGLFSLAGLLSPFRPKEKPEAVTRIVIEKWIEAGLAAIAAGGCSGHWLVCCRCKRGWKDRVEPDPPGGRRWYYCVRCGAEELGSVILADYLKRGAP